MRLRLRRERLLRRRRGVLLRVDEQIAHDRRAADDAQQTEEVRLHLRKIRLATGDHEDCSRKIGREQNDQPRRPLQTRKAQPIALVDQDSIDASVYHAASRRTQGNEHEGDQGPSKLQMQFLASVAHGQRDPRSARDEQQ